MRTEAVSRLINIVQGKHSWGLWELYSVDMGKEFFTEDCGGKLAGEKLEVLPRFSSTVPEMAILSII